MEKRSSQVNVISANLYLDVAKKYVGLKEVKGVKTEPTITNWLVKLGAWWRDDETPWCGVALAAWLSEAGLAYPKKYFRALEWLNYGYPVAFPKQGAIAVLSRKGGGHVGLVTGVDKLHLHVRILGGNQGNRVCEKWYPINTVVGFRMPPYVYPVQAAMIATIGEELYPKQYKV